MRVRTFLLVLLGVALLASPAFSAEKGDSKVRFGLQYVSPTGDLTQTEPETGATLTVEADTAIGFFAEYEYMVSDKAGLFGNISMQNHDVDGRVTLGPLSLSATVGDLDLMPVEFGVNFHFGDSEKLDFFVGPKVAYVMVGDLELNAQGVDLFESEINKVKMKDDFGFGAQAGLDVPLGDSNWVFTAGVQYLMVSAEIDEPGESVEVDIDPFIVKAGVGVQW